MGCTSSNLLNQDDDFTHHIVSLTSTTYGLLTLDPSSSPTTVPPTPPPRFTLSDPPHDVINSWELMAGLDSTPETLRFSPQPSKPSPFRFPLLDIDPTFQENSNPNHKNPIFTNPNPKNPIFTNPSPKIPIFTNPNPKSPICTNPNPKNPIFTNPNDKNPIFTNPNVKNPIFTNPNVKNPIFSNPNDKNPIFTKPVVWKPDFLSGFEQLCPPKGENKVVIYTTTLRGVRKTFEACNAVRAVLEGSGVFYCERDISMDRGFKEELWELMKGKEKQELVPPRVFVKGRYLGGCDEVLKIVEEGCLGQLVEGLPKSKPGYVCETCGGARFLPCFGCNGSCKLVNVMKNGIDGDQLGKTVTVKCTDCNENGLVRCSICS